jgi:hypothetical protein
LLVRLGATVLKISAQFSRPHLCLFILSLVSWFLVNPSGATASAAHREDTPAMVRLPGHMLPALSKATIVPSNSDSDTQPITLTLVFRHDDQPAFRTLPARLV